MLEDVVRALVLDEIGALLRAGGPDDREPHGTSDLHSPCADTTTRSMDQDRLSAASLGVMPERRVGREIGYPDRGALSKRDSVRQHMHLRLEGDRVLGIRAAHC